jgi:hypothetical protein
MVLMLSAVACKHQEKVPAPLPAAPADPLHGMGGPMGAKKESAVVVPEALKGRWKSARIVVTDIASKKETSHVVPVGSDFLLPGTGLTLRIESLLPDFTMGGGTITSKSEKMDNPAAQVRIFEGGKENFKGWMFVKFPDTHAFQHSKYALKLVEFVP